MYFTNVIRRAASRVIPSASQRYYHHQSLFSTAAPIAPPQNLSRCSFSTVIQRIYARKRKLVEQPSTTRRDSDDALLKVLNSEIHWAQEANENYKIEDVPESLPFIIFDQPGEKRLTLTRHYYGERITVEVHIGQPTTDKEEDTEVENSNDSDYNDESDDVERVLLVSVKVSKNDGPRFLFFVSAYPGDEIEIEHLSIYDPDTGKDPYVGPEFGDLDENLKEFHKYLDNRGINSSSAKILYEYMMKKESNDYEGWLKKASSPHMSFTQNLTSFEFSLDLSRKAFRLGKFIQDINSFRASKFYSRQELLLSLIAYGGEGLYYFIEQFVWLVV